MSLLRYFKHSVPTVKQIGIGEEATKSANVAVLELQDRSRGRKRYMDFSEEERVQIGRYAAENGDISALKKFKAQSPDLAEGMVRLQKKYLALLEEKRHAGDSCPMVLAVPSKKRGKPGP